MNCKKIQRLVDELARERLSQAVAREVRQHLSDCTDCRVQHQRAARLQQLLAVKRYERPAPGYLDGFLDDFHRRQRAERDRAGARWSDRRWWITAVLRWESWRSWQYGLAGTVATVAVLAGLTWATVRTGNPVHVVSSGHPGPREALVMATEVASLPAPSPDALAVHSSLPSLPQPSTAASVVVIPARREPAEAGAPWYVLDRITVTPVSYETASVHF